MPKTSSIRPVVVIQYQLLTDGQTKRQTHDDSIASRGKNWMRVATYVSSGCLSDVADVNKSTVGVGD